RMQTTRLAAVFDIDAEDKPAQLGVLTAIATSSRLECPQTREDDRISRGRTRLRTADLVIGRVAEGVIGSRTDEGAVAAAAKASALEGVEYALHGTYIGIVRMEFRVNGVLRAA